MIDNPFIQAKALKHAEETNSVLVAKKSTNFKAVFERNGLLRFCRITMDSTGYTHFEHYTTRKA